MNRIIENLINGNLSIAKEQATRVSYRELLEAAEEVMPTRKARAAADYLKPRKQEDRAVLFQTYCNTDD
jgi:hypothetical protein